MADNKKWFKVWTSLLIDLISDDLSLEDIGRFTVLGCLIAQKGNKGELVLSENTLNTFLKCNKMPEKFIKNFHLREAKSDNGEVIVSFAHWHKYQMDSTGYERVKKHRSKRKDNGTREEKIREEKDKKRRVGEYGHVLLSDKDYQKLIERFGESKTKGLVKTLDEGIELKGYKYKSHYLAILKWEKGESGRESPPDPKNNPAHRSGSSKATLEKMEADLGGFLESLDKNHPTYAGHQKRLKEIKAKLRRLP